MADTVDQDKQEILRLHREWWNANHGLDIAWIRQVIRREKYLILELAWPTVLVGWRRKPNLGALREGNRDPDATDGL